MKTGKEDVCFMHTCHCFKYTFLMDKEILIILIFSCQGSKQENRMGSQTMEKSLLLLSSLVQTACKGSNEESRGPLY